MPNVSYTSRQIAGIWFAAVLPVIAVAWGLVPALLPHFTIAAVKLYWILMPLVTAAQLAVVAWIVRREEGNLTWAAVKRRLRLNLPQSPKTGEPSARRMWWVLPWAVLLALTTAIGLVLVIISPLRFLAWPSYATMSELASPGFAGQWWWVVIILFLWACHVCAEESLFRGVLLPRMSGWGNGLLYGLYHVYKPWAIPFRLVEAVAVVRPARIFGSTTISIAIRGAEGLFVLGMLLAGVQAVPFRPLPAQLGLPMISRQPGPVDFRRGASAALPDADGAGVRDLRGRNLSSLDLRGASSALRMANFDDRTRWPVGGRMPADFDWTRVMDIGKNPGLGVRQLHAQRITGREIGIGIVDNPLLTDHAEYRERLQWYEELDTGRRAPAQMHAPAVASIAVGATVGVAPEARLYFIGIGDNPLGLLRRCSNLARGIWRLLEVNRRLPEGQKLRVISISNGWSPGTPGYNDVEAAVREARENGIFVVSSNLEETYGFRFHGLGRSELADPDQFQSYEPGLFWANEFYRGRRARNRLLIPMDSRTIASPTGNREYVFDRGGGWSWSIPYIAGVYALAAQVDPTIAPERFWATALKTGRAITLQHGSQEVRFGPIIDPPALIAALQQR